MDCLEYLKKINESSPHVSLRKGTNLTMILRSEHSLPGFTIPKELKEIYKFTNGFSILDYAFYGVRTSKYNIESNTNSLWLANDLMKVDFIGLVCTTYGINIGFLEKVKSSTNEHIIAFNDDLMEEYLIIISTSFEKFIFRMFSFFEENPPEEENGFYFNNDAWLYDMAWWLDNDSELVEMYRSGKLDHYYKNNQDFVKFIDGYLKNL